MMPFHQRRLVVRALSITMGLTALAITLGLSHGGAAPTMKLDPEDRDLAGIVPALPTVEDFPPGKTGTMFFAVHLRGYQGSKVRKVILGLKEEAGGPCIRFDDSGGFSFATTRPGGIEWFPGRGVDNGAVAVYRALVHNWYSHFPIGCEAQVWDDSGAATGIVSFSFRSDGRIQISHFGVTDGAECKGGCPAGWNQLFVNEVFLTSAQRADLDDPKITEVIIPFRFRASFTDDSAKESQPCYEVNPEEVNCSWTGASLAYLHLIRLASQDEFNRIVKAGVTAATELTQNTASGGGTATTSGSTGAYPLSGIGSPMVGWIPCDKEPERRRCMPWEDRPRVPPE